MITRTSPWPAGAPCWAALSTSDEARAREFYGAVLGWSFRDVGPRQHDWTVAERDDGLVAGLGAMAQDEQESSWLLAFAVDGCDAAAARVVNAGGAVLQPPHDVLAGAARAAVARDRAGRRLMLLQAGEFTGFTRVNAPGALVWEDGIGPADDADRRFYADVLGWEIVPAPEVGGSCYAFGAPGEPATPWGVLDGDAVLAPQWLLWFGVEVVDAAVDAVIDAGGGVLAGPRDTPWGRLARVQDPDGAQFGVMSPEFADLPDRS